MSEHEQTTAVELVQLQPQPTLSIRGVTTIAALGDTQGQRLQALGKYLQQLGIKPAGPPFVRYHTFGERETDMETGVPLAAPTDGAGQIVSGELPGGPAATIIHLGSHDRLGEAYGRLHGWIGQNGREAEGAGWEIYHWIDLDHSHESAPWPEPSAWRAELVQPLKDV